MPFTFLANNFFDKLTKFFNVGATACTSTQATGTTQGKLSDNLEITFHSKTIVNLIIIKLNLLSVTV